MTATFTPQDKKEIIIELDSNLPQSNSDIDRLATKVQPIILDDYEENQPKPFSYYLSQRNVILLGDPGAGKTYLFDKTKDVEGGIWFSARNFLNYANKEEHTNKTIYIDALDEKRSRTDNAQSVDEIVRLLNKIKPEKVRLSCREADWLGETDLEVFKPYFEANGGYVVVRLQSLTNDEIDNILKKCGATDPSEFRKHAYQRKASQFLRNPQTLIMLYDVVNQYGWPKTIRELYQKSLELVLLEHNKKHGRENLGRFKSEELLLPAGAACACLLIADVGGISLLENTTNDDFPSYKHIPEDANKILSALTRRAFVSIGDETVSYIHRTVAEFLAATWLANKARNGFPIYRIQNLIGVDGHPAPELRGLHAWLAILLPEYADILIAADPYGVLIYGDSASLSLTHRKLLLNAVVEQSKKDPWLRNGNWSSDSLGTLSGSDMVEDFRQLLSSPESSFHLRSIVLDAIEHGPELPEMADQLLDIMCNEEGSYYEREVSFRALIKVIPNGIALAVNATKTRLSLNGTSTRLRAYIIARLYEGHFLPEDVLKLFKDVLNDTEQHIIGELREIADLLPLGAVLELLDRINTLQLKENIEGHRTNGHEITYCFSDMLIRGLESNITFETGRVWNWFSTLYYVFSKRNHLSERKNIKAWLERNENFVLAMFHTAITEFDPKKGIGRFWHDFNAIIMHTANRNKIASFAFESIAPKSVFTKKEKFLYQLSIELNINTPPHDHLMFERLFEFGNQHAELLEVREKACLCEVHDWNFKESERKIEYKQKQLKGKIRNHNGFKEHIESIQSGDNRGWLDWIAHVYFAKFADVNTDISPKERLTQELGEEYAVIALNGLQAILQKADLPSPKVIAEYNNKSQYYRWWFAVIAGMDECWIEHPSLQYYPDEILKSALAIDLVLPTYSKKNNVTSDFPHEWKKELFKFRPELVQSVYVEMARFGLESNSSRVIGITEICENEHTLERGCLALKLVQDFPNAEPEYLKSLLLTIISIPSCHPALIDMIEPTLGGVSKVAGDQYAMWLATGFLVSFNQFQDAIEEYAVVNRAAIIWTLKDFIEKVRDQFKDKLFELSTEQFRFIIKLTGSHFPNVDYPNKTTIGNKNPENGAEFVCKLINILSSRTTKEAVALMIELIEDDNLCSYRDHIKHAAANQASLCREKEYQQPDWNSTIKALSNTGIANIADLHAITIDHLRTVSDTIRHSNTDTYKKFWNEDSYGRIGGDYGPKNEESCRDRLVDLLRPEFRLLNVHVEPEGHMASDKRADIILLPPALAKQKLPLELKKDTHTDLWTACETQLERLYSRDPDAGGYGIYVIFWFGNKRTGKVPTPPSPLKLPDTAQELEDSIRLLIPEHKRHKLEVIVIDVSPPVT